MIPVYMGLTSSLINKFTAIDWAGMDTFSPEDIDRMYRNVFRHGEEAIHYFNRDIYGVDTGRDGIYASRAEYEYVLDELGEDFLEDILEVFNRFLQVERRRISSLALNISPSTDVYVSMAPKPYRRVGVLLPYGKPFMGLKVIASAYAAGVKELYISTPPLYRDGLPDPVILGLTFKLNYGYIIKGFGPPASSLMTYGSRNIPRCERIIYIGDGLYSLAKYSMEHIPSMYVNEAKRLGILIDSTANLDSVVMDLYSWFEARPNAKACIVAYKMRVVEELLTIEDEKGGIIFFKNLRDRVRGNTFIVVVDSWDEAISVLNNLSPDYLHIEVERDVRYRVIDYIRNVNIFSVGDTSSYPYLRSMGGFSDLINILGGTGIHSSIDYVRWVTYVRSGPDALIKDYELAGRIYDKFSLPGHYYALKTRIDNL